MRTAAKVASTGIASAGLRSAPLAEHSVWQASRPVSAVLSSSSSSSQGANPALQAFKLLSTSSEVQTVAASVAADPNVRNAIMENPKLKDFCKSLQKAAGFEAEEFPENSEELLNSDKAANRGNGFGDFIEANSTISVPNQALQAFKFLSTSSEAQTVVASVASDPKVWNAIMENQTLKDFCESRQKAAGFEAEESPENSEELPNSDKTANRGNGFGHFKDLMQKVKLTVTEMVSSASNYLNNIFGLPAAGKSSSDATGNTKASFMDPFAMEGIMGLLVLVAMVVLLKRV